MKLYKELLNSGMDETEAYRKAGADSYQQVIDFNEDLGDFYMPNKEYTQFRMAKLMVLNGQQKEADAIFFKLLNSTQRADLKEEIRRELS